jgi:hypothetical protein
VTRTLKLLLGTVALWLMVGSVMSLLRDGLVTPLGRRPTLIVSGLAMAVALIPALAAAVLNDLLERGTAETQTVGLLVGVGLRLAVTMVLAVFVDRLYLPRVEAAFREPPAARAADTGPSQPGDPAKAAEPEPFRGPSAFLVWVLFFYLATLALTTILLIVNPTRTTPPEPRPDHPGAQQHSHGA